MNRIFKRIAVGVLALVVAACVLPWAMVSIGTLLYNGQNYDSANAALTVARYTSLYDRDVILYNLGNGQYQTEQYQQAAADYQEADAISTDAHRCMIHYNWAQSLVAQGQRAESTSSSAALAHYTEALRVVVLQQCQNDPTYKDRFDKLRLAILEKIIKLTLAASGKPNQTQTDPNLQDAEALLNKADEVLQQRQYEDGKSFDERQSSGSSSGAFTR